MKNAFLAFLAGVVVGGFCLLILVLVMAWTEGRLLAGVHPAAWLVIVFVIVAGGIAWFHNRGKDTPEEREWP